MKKRLLNREYHQVRLLMKGVPNWLIYDIEPDDVQQFQQELRSPLSDTYFCFKANRDQRIVISRPDIQVANFLCHRAAYRQVNRTIPRFEIYLRGNPTPYCDELGEVGDLDLFPSEAPIDPDGFLTFLDGDGEAVFLNPDDVMLLTYTEEDARINVTTLLSAEGTFTTEELDGRWEVLVWQEPDDEQWYSNVVFTEDDESSEAVYEFDVLGPYQTKSAAVEAILADFESGRYSHYVTLIDDQMDMNDLLNSVGET
jgi:hypothetical protein